MKGSLRSTLIAVGALVLSSASSHADFRFVHITDTHITATNKAGSNFEKDSKLFREIDALQPKPALVVSTGDTVEVGTPAEYKFLLEAQQNLTVPLYAAPGNHDVRWNPLGKEGYQDGAKQPLYQSWDYENVHFVLLDSTVLLQHWGHFDQAMLDWLRDDLKKVGPTRPIIIGFHHWVGREGVQIDNEAELLAITAPYNVRLWLQGHGHSDIQWNVNGAPAIMAKGLYQGSYHIIEVSQDRLRVLRRTEEAAVTPVQILEVPLAPQAAPAWKASFEWQGDQLTIRAQQGDLPVGTKIDWRLAGAWAPLTAAGNDWSSSTDVSNAKVGEHRLQVRATLPDGRVYFQALPLSLRREGAPAPSWVAPLGGAVQSKLIHSGDTLYVSSMGGELFALNPATGTIRWRFRTGGALFSTPLVSDGTVYVGSADHFVYAIDANTGKQKWKTETGGAVFAGAARSGGIICIASVDTKIYGLDEKSGAVRWTAKGEGMYQSQAATDGERFFVGGWDNYFRALDVQSGRELWKNKFGRSFYFSPAIGSPTVGAGKVFVTSNDGLMHAMDAATGKVVWEVPGPSLGYSGPLFHNGKIYNASLTGTGRVFCIDARDGKILWDTPTGAVIYDSSCAWSDAAGGTVYVGSVNGTFSAISAQDGKLRWQYQLAPGHVLASPATDARRVFIGSMNGSAVALPQ